VVFSKKQIRLYKQKVARPEAGLFGLLFGYFLVRSAATHSKMSLNQRKNPSLLPQAPSVHKVYCKKVILTFLQHKSVNKHAMYRKILSCKTFWKASE
jgi:hypothetical protein